MQPQPKSLPRNLRGFTLVELLTVSVLIALFSLAVFSQVRDAVPLGRDRNAVSLAGAVNAAKKSYELRVSSASANWTAAADDDARWLLIRDRVAYAENLTLGQFVPSGYTFTLGGSLSTRVTVTGPSGAVSY